MLSQDSIKRSPPHCRTCGKAMKGHKLALCQLRSPSEDVGRSLFSSSSLASSSSSLSLIPLPPSTPQRRQLQYKPLSRAYPYDPITEDPSWVVPPEGEAGHRRNPNIESPFGVPPLVFLNANRNYNSNSYAPIRRTDSWQSTEVAESEYGGGTGGRRAFFARPPTPPYTPQNSIREEEEEEEQRRDDDDTTADNTNKNKNLLSGLSLSTLADPLRAVLRQATRMGMHATVVRPQIVGHDPQQIQQQQQLQVQQGQRNSVRVRTDHDANQHAAVFVSGSSRLARRRADDDDDDDESFMAFNMTTDDRHRGRRADQQPLARRAGGSVVAMMAFWTMLFSAMFVASLFAGWVNTRL